MDDRIPKPAGLHDLRHAIARVLSERGIASPDTATPPVEPVEPVEPVDFRVLAVLVDELGDRAIVAGVVEAFLGEIDLRVGHIIVAVATGDAPTAHHWVHTLSSSARTVGASRLAEMGRAVERGEATPEAFRALAEQVRDALIAWGATG
jgi:HPt (histidine-containing phosphotransfer) domain-containing protein